MKKSAFTMIELVFVIIVLGILASLAMGRMDRDLKQEAADMVLSHIRLTQQMALNDNKHLPNSPNNWQKAYWRIQFINCDSDGDVKPIYNVGSNRDLNEKLSKEESAVDPINGKYLYATCISSSIGDDVAKEIFIGKHYGIENVKLTGCSTISGTTARQIGFDYLGRPHRGVSGYSNPDFSRLVRSDCNLTFTMSTDQDGDGAIDTFNIIIEDETGYAYIEGQKS